jgi:hypothetical protein
MTKIIAILFLAIYAFCADFHHTASSSSSSSKQSSSESNSTTGSKSKETKSSKAHYVSVNNNDTTEFSVASESGFAGTLYLENAKEHCEFVDKALEKQGSSFVFKDAKTECRFSIKVKSGSVSAKSNGQACIEAGYCSKKDN